SRNTLRNILFSWPLTEVRHFFTNDLGIPLKEESSGKLFPVSDRAVDVARGLLDALRRSGAVLRAPWRVTVVERLETGGFVLTSADGERLECQRLVLATGGLSWPKTGSDGVGLDLAVGLSHGRVPTHPALVPLLSADAGWRALSGLSVRVRLTVEDHGRRIDEGEGELLFTHRGFSGPVILDLSGQVTRRGGDVVLRVHWGGSAIADWDDALRAGGRRTVGSVLRRQLPDRLAAALLQRAAVAAETSLSELPRATRLRLVDILSRFELPVRGSAGFKSAEVTGGGIPLAEVTPATLESRIVPGLHFCGEMLDVTGRLGGYNFLWAWVTGHKVGQAVGHALG
ncbi:MAG: aminoacetone oxidase family FAD-binding enzyme, partial [bacterium]